MHTIFLPVMAFFTAALSGTIGFGGAILLLPILTATLGVAKAVPLLTFIQIVGNASRVIFARSEINWAAAKTFLITAVPFSMLGAYSFVSAPKGIMLKLIGVSILLFIVLKLFGVTKAQVSKKNLPYAGAIVGFLSGLLGTAGPLGAAVFMSMNLPPLTYISTDAFSSLVMHTAKAIVYHPASADFASLSILTIVMSATTILGTLVGNKIAKRIPENLFRHAVTAVVVIAAIQMVFSA